MRITALRTLLPALLALPACLPSQAPAQPDRPPGALDLSQVKFQIVGATFVSKLDGAGARYTESQPDLYRGLLLTVRIAKAPGAELTLVAQDITLHYRYGDQSDAAKCYGVSNFTTQPEHDRTMALYTQGWGRSTTGMTATKSGTVYVDLFFQNMEPETRDLYLFIAQPASGRFTTPGWKKD